MGLGSIISGIGKGLSSVVSGVSSIPFLGNIIGGGSSYLSGTKSNQSSEYINSKTLALSKEQLAQQYKEWSFDYALQKRMAEQGFQIRSKDIIAASKRTGLSPLALLGIQPFSPGPVSTTPGSIPNLHPGSYDYMAKMGQDISRAVKAVKTPEDREKIAEDRYYERTYKTQELTLRQQQIQRNDRELQNQPTIPSKAGIIPGQSGINNVPSERVISGGVGVEKGVKPLNKLTVDRYGGIHFPFGKAGEEAMENNWIATFKYMLSEGLHTAGNIGKSFLSRFTKVRSHEQYKKTMRSYIAAELGVKPSDIGYIGQIDQFYVKPSAKRKLNKGR